MTTEVLRSNEKSTAGEVLARGYKVMTDPEHIEEVKRAFALKYEGYTFLLVQFNKEGQLKNAYGGVSPEMTESSTVWRCISGGKGLQI